MQTGLVAEKLQKSYKGRKVVRECSLKVGMGQIIGLLGPNGAGKTTSFYMICGLVAPDGGSITIDSKDITSYPIHLRAEEGIGYLPQEPSVFRDLSVEDNVMAVLEYVEPKASLRKMLLEELLEDFGLKRVRTSLGKALSGGERRRVEIARTLALNPKYVLLDEPFAGVDPLAVSDIQSIVGNLKERGIGVLITDHNVRETLGIVDKAYIMVDGQILVEGSPEKILNDEKVKKFYLGDQFKI